MHIRTCCALVLSLLANCGGLPRVTCLRWLRHATYRGSCFKRITIGFGRRPEEFAADFDDTTRGISRGYARNGTFTQMIPPTSGDGRSRGQQYIRGKQAGNGYVTRARCRYDVGLVNGLRGEVVEIVCDRNKPAPAPPRYVVVRFDGYTELDWSGRRRYTMGVMLLCPCGLRDRTRAMTTKSVR